MRFSVFLIPAIAAMAAAHPTEVSEEGDLFARDEYRWCLGTTPHVHITREPMTDIPNRREDQLGYSKEVQLPHARDRHRQVLQERKRPFEGHQELPCWRGMRS